MIPTHGLSTCMWKRNTWGYLAVVALVEKGEMDDSFIVFVGKYRVTDNMYLGAWLIMGGVLMGVI